MKKTLALLAVVAAIVITTGICFAAKEKTKDGQKPAKGRTSQSDALRQKMQQRRQPGSTNPEDRMKRFKERYDEEVKRATEVPLATIRELTAIKQIAEKEKAKKTIAAIDQLIAKTKTQMDQKVRTIEDRQAKFKEFLEKRGTGPGRPESDRPVRPGTRKRPTKVTDKPADKK